MRRTRADIQNLKTPVTESSLQHLLGNNSPHGMTVLLRPAELPPELVEETRSQLAAILADHPEQEHVYVINAETPGKSRGLNYIQYGENARTTEEVVVRIQHTDSIDSDTRALNDVYKPLSQGNPHLVELFEAGWSHEEEHSRMIAAVERLPDSPRLSDVIDDIPLTTYLEYVQQALVGVGALHENKLTYRDLDTGNLLVVDDAESEGKRVVLHDIDLIGLNKKGKGTLQGKHETIPPELRNPTGYPEGQQWITGWTDMYAARLLIAEKLGITEDDTNEPLPLTGHYTPLQHHLHTLYLACGSMDPPLRPTAKELHAAIKLVVSLPEDSALDAENAASKSNEMLIVLEKKYAAHTATHDDIQMVIDAFTELREFSQSDPGTLYSQIGRLYLMHAELDPTREDDINNAEVHYRSALSIDPYNMETHVRRLYKIADIREEKEERGDWGSVLDHLLHDDVLIEELRNKILKDHPVLSMLEEAFHNGVPEEGLPDDIKNTWNNLEDTTRLQLRTVLMHYIETSIVATEKGASTYEDTLRMSNVAMSLDGASFPARFWSDRAIALSELARSSDADVNIPKVLLCLKKAILLNPSASQLRDHAVLFCKEHGLDDDVISIIKKTAAERRSAYMWRVLSEITEDEESDTALQNSLLLDTTDPDTNLRCAEHIIAARPINCEALHLHLSRVFCCNDDASEFLHTHYQTLLSKDIIDNVDRKKLFSVFILWKERSDDGAHEPYLAACRALERYSEYHSAVKELAAQYPRLLETTGNPSLRSILEEGQSQEPSFALIDEEQTPKHPYQSTIARQGSFPVRFPSALPNPTQTLKHIPALLLQTSLDDASRFTVEEFLTDILPHAQSHSFVPWDGEQFNTEKTVTNGVYMPSSAELLLFATGLREAKFTVNDVGQQSSVTTITAPVYDGDTLLGVLHAAHTALRGEEDINETHVDSMGLVAKLLGRIPEKIRTEEAASSEKHLRKVLAQATEIQKTLLQPIDPDMWDGYTMSGEWLSGTMQGGGDGYFLHELSDGKKFFAHFDVSGHGANCIPIQVAIMTALHERARAGNLDGDLKTLTNDINLSLQELITGSNMFATAILGYIEPGEGEEEDTVSIFHAAHEPAIVVEADGTTRQEFDETKGSFPLLLDIPMMEFSGIHTFKLQKGDTLVLTTDGTSEVVNADGDMLGNKGVAQFIANYDGPKGQTAQALHAYVTEYAKGSANGVFDDTTTLTFTKN
jgi:serine phosphatase RsbU (regulator of sigma subunit)/tetratricopeptide (TPR) repeat protein